MGQSAFDYKLQTPFFSVDIDLVRAFYAAVIILVVDRVVAFQKKRRSLSYLPGIRSPFSPISPIGALVATRWWQAAVNVNWVRRARLYTTTETIASTPWLSGPPLLYTSNLDVAKQIISIGQSKSQFGKTPETSASSNFFGDNVLSTEGEEWKKHRKILSPAFGNALYQLVWDESLKTYRDMVSAEGWIGQKSIDVPELQKATFKFALIVLGTCAFGFDFDWVAPPRVANGEMSVQEAMRVVVDNWIFFGFAPGWVKRLPIKTISTWCRAADQLERFMQDQVTMRREEIRGYAQGEYRKKDAFSMLVQANESDENARNKLSDRDLIGNVFVMLFAGHETTANTLAATLALLAINPEAQDEVLKHIIDVVGWDRDPTFADYNDLNKVLAAFFEALRLFPPAYMMIRAATEDIVLDIPKPRGEEGVQPCHVPKGVWTVVDMIGMYRNPRYFEDAEEYRPSRWHTTPNDSEQFTAFSFGPRACIGRKFATTEAICFLTMLLRDFEVEPLLERGETLEEWKGRVLDVDAGFTLAIRNVPVRFVRRERPRA
ncbi:hypothetical protein V5O48_009611 [Marasmius crinis-equi]|uniref:Cytochrome P450 n=1 Tax=Marasmius crinis-equi TaxID=585013 RepID=A0ABR3FAQ5_9AGAR